MAGWGGDTFGCGEIDEEKTAASNRSELDWNGDHGMETNALIQETPKR